MERYTLLIGRILAAFIFLMAGINKIGNPSGTQAYMATFGMPLTGLFLAGAIAIEILGSLSLIAGYYTKLGAWALIIFMIPTTLIFHTNFSDQNQFIHFMKNVSMTGGLLYIATYGAGAWSMDARRK